MEQASPSLLAVNNDAWCAGKEKILQEDLVEQSLEITKSARKFDMVLTATNSVQQ